MGISAESRVLVIDAPAAAVAAIELPTEYAVTDDGVTEFDHIIVFTRTQAELELVFDRFRTRLGSASKLWVAWPKAGRLRTDLSIKHVIRIGYDRNLVESTNLRIDDDWTALKFTHPKPGKTYQNSYGRLPENGDAAP